jgi:hypothetical protein
MALKDRHAINVIRAERLPLLEQAIERVLGRGFAIEFDQDGVEALGAEAIMRIEDVARRIFEGIEFLAGRDDFTRDAIAQSLGGIRILNAESADEIGATVQDGELQVRSMLTDHYARTVDYAQIAEALDQGL